MELLTSIGLALPAGLNAYIPLLAVSIAGRAGLLTLAAPYDLISEWWAMALIAVLLVVEIVADKLPAVDHVNDVIQTVIRPAAGGLVAVASPGAATDVSPVLLIALGILLAGGVHVAKATTRPAVNASTAGVGGPVASVVEDVVALVTSVAAVLAPILVVAAAALFGWLLWALPRRGGRAR